MWERKRSNWVLSHISTNIHITDPHRRWERKRRKYTTNKKNREEALTDWRSWEKREEGGEIHHDLLFVLSSSISLLVFDCFPSVSDWITVTSSPSLACALKGQEVRGRGKRWREKWSFSWMYASDWRQSIWGCLTSSRKRRDARWERSRHGTNSHIHT